MRKLKKLSVQKAKPVHGQQAKSQALKQAGFAKKTKTTHMKGRSNS